MSGTTTCPTCGYEFDFVFSGPCSDCARELADDQRCEVCGRPSDYRWCPRCAEDM